MIINLTSMKTCEVPVIWCSSCIEVNQRWQLKLQVVHFHWRIFFFWYHHQTQKSLHKQPLEKSNRKESAKFWQQCIYSYNLHSSYWQLHCSLILLHLVLYLYFSVHNFLGFPYCDFWPINQQVATKSMQSAVLKETALITHQDKIVSSEHE